MQGKVTAFELVAVVLATLLLGAAESAHAKRVVGTNGPDRLVGTAKADQIRSLAGDDRIKGRGGKDRLSAGPGTDRINAVDGKRDRAVSGGPGDDVCRIDAADLSRMKGCESAKVAGGAGAGECVTAPKPRLRGDLPPTFGDAFHAITLTLNASADGLNGDELPISIEEVCDVPQQLAAEAAQLIGGAGIAIIGGDTRIFDAVGQELTGDAATTALAEADSLTLKAQLQRPAQWRQDEKGQPVPTFGTSRADITD
jgi:hypothetical protein